MDDRLWVDEPTHRLLNQWKRWCNGHYLPVEFSVRCGSIESRHIAEDGDVREDSEYRLSKAMESARAPFPDYLGIEVTKIVMRLPDKYRLALKLHYIVGLRMSKNQKRRLLGVTHDRYFVIVYAAALMLRNRLTQQGIVIDCAVPTRVCTNGQTRLGETRLTTLGETSI